MALEVGDRLGDYEIVQRLRSGGMAALFLGRRAGAAGFAREVAIKIVHPHLTRHPGFVQMFVHEALLSSRIHHPNVVHVEELGEAAGHYFLVMEYVRGCALGELMTRLAEVDARLAPEVATWIAIQVADALHAAHETRDAEGRALGVVHCDVSPQNVLLAGTGHVKLIDFGIAKSLEGGLRARAGQVQGKLRYMSPEQARGAPLDARADVYSLGVVLWEMLTMRRLCDGTAAEIKAQVRDPRVAPPSRFAPGIAPLLDAAVMTALAPERDRRFASALELRRALAASMPAAASLEASRLADVMAEAMLPVGTVPPPAPRVEHTGVTLAVRLIHDPSEAHATTHVPVAMVPETLAGSAPRAPRTLLRGAALALVAALAIIAGVRVAPHGAVVAPPAHVSSSPAPAPVPSPVPPVTAVTPAPPRPVEPIAPPTAARPPVRVAASAHVHRASRHRRPRRTTAHALPVQTAGY